MYPYDLNAIAIPSQAKRKPPQPIIDNPVSPMSQTVEDSSGDEDEDGHGACVRYESDEDGGIECDIENRESACGGKDNKLSTCGEGEDDGSPSKELFDQD